MALVFDLDDTLVDTYGAVIVPLEHVAARSMRGKDPSLPNEEELAQLLLVLRRKSPDQVERELRDRFQGIIETALAARRDVVERSPVQGIYLPVAVRGLLMALHDVYRLYLLTAGERNVQEAKIESLQLAGVFDETVILDRGSEADKEDAIASLLTRHGHTPSSTLVIGNRLDREIRAGNRLGLSTVWVRRGEGSGMEPGEATGKPDHVISDVLELPTTLGQLSHHRGR